MIGSCAQPLPLNIYKVETGRQKARRYLETPVLFAMLPLGDEKCWCRSILTSLFIVSLLIYLQESAWLEGLEGYCVRKKWHRPTSLKLIATVWQFFWLAATLSNHSELPGGSIFPAGWFGRVWNEAILSENHLPFPNRTISSTWLHFNP